MIWKTRSNYAINAMQDKTNAMASNDKTRMILSSFFYLPHITKIFSTLTDIVQPTVNYTRTGTEPGITESLRSPNATTTNYTTYYIGTTTTYYCIL